MWRTSQDSGEPVCCCNDCWRAEGWMPEKQQRGPKPRPKSGGAGSSQDQLGAQTKAYISGITKIEGQRCARFCPPRGTRAPLQALRRPDSSSPPAARARRFCDPTGLSMLAYGRCMPAEQTKPSYLVLGHFKPSEQHPGFPDKRWLTLAELKASGLEMATIKEKLTEFEAAIKVARDAELDAAPAPAPAPVPAAAEGA